MDIALAVLMRRGHFADLEPGGGDQLPHVPDGEDRLRVPAGGEDPGRQREGLRLCLFQLQRGDDLRPAGRGLRQRGPGTAGEEVRPPRRVRQRPEQKGGEAGGHDPGGQVRGQMAHRGVPLVFLR